MLINIVGAFNEGKDDIGAGEAFLNAHVGSINNAYVGAGEMLKKPLVLSLSKEKVLNMIAAALENEHCELGMDFGDIKIIVK